MYNFTKFWERCTFLTFPLSSLLTPSTLSLLSSFKGLGGCIRGLTVRSDETNPPASQSVNLFAATRHSVRVYLDGCPTAESWYNCRGNDSVLVYSGRKTQATDYNVQPFTGEDPYIDVTTLTQRQHSPIKEAWTSNSLTYRLKTSSKQYKEHDTDFCSNS